MAGSNRRTGRQGVNYEIGALDANPRTRATRAAGPAPAPAHSYSYSRAGYYADDDSVVSSNVSEPDSAVRGRDGDDDRDDRRYLEQVSLSGGSLSRAAYYATPGDGRGSSDDRNGRRDQESSSVSLSGGSRSHAAYYAAPDDGGSNSHSRSRAASATPSDGSGGAHGRAAYYGDGSSGSRRAVSLASGGHGPKFRRDAFVQCEEEEEGEEDEEEEEFLQRDEEARRCMMFSRREMGCISCIVLLLILTVALASVYGFGFYFTNTEGETVKLGGDKDNVTSLGNSVSFPPTSSPVSLQSGPTASPGRPRPPPGDLGGAIEYHAVVQEISSLSSFFEAGGESSPQRRARDFLAFEDYLSLKPADKDSDPNWDDDLTVALSPRRDDDLTVAPRKKRDDDLTVAPRKKRKNDKPKRRRKPKQPERRSYLTTNTPAYRVAQRFAAAVLYYATNGENWEVNQMWLSPGAHECDWVGVMCKELYIPAMTLEEALDYPDKLPRHDDWRHDETAERMIIAIDLPENNLGGSLPMEIAALPHLRRLGLWSNRIGGSLPTELGRLTQLSSLHLDDNAFGGNIPRTIGGMAAMTELFLDHNEGIVGRIPPEIGNLARLERLMLSDMMLRGPIPTTFGKLTNLVDLSLQNNRLSRGLPEELGDLVNLESLTLSGNSFTGEIPASWRGLVRLKRLEVQSNKMLFDMDRRICALRNDAPGGRGGQLEALVADCRGGQGKAPRVACSCCTGCLP